MESDIVTATGRAGKKWGDISTCWQKNWPTQNSMIRKYILQNEGIIKTLVGKQKLRQSFMSRHVSKGQWGYSSSRKKRSRMERRSQLSTGRVSNQNTHWLDIITK